MSKLFLYADKRSTRAIAPPAIATRIAWAWLLAGTLGTVCLPELRERSEWIGWLPLWLVIMPLAQLLLLRWRRVLAVSRSLGARVSSRPARSTARRSRRRAASVRPRRPARQAEALLSAMLFR